MNLGGAREEYRTKINIKRKILRYSIRTELNIKSTTTSGIEKTVSIVLLVQHG